MYGGALLFCCIVITTLNCIYARPALGGAISLGWSLKDWLRFSIIF